MAKHKGGLDTEQFRLNLCEFLSNAIKKYVRTSPLNHLAAFDNEPIVDEPIVAFADGDDQIFEDFKTIIGEFHLTPREIMEKYVSSKNWRFGSKNNIDNIGIVSWALPLAKKPGLWNVRCLLGDLPGTIIQGGLE